MKVFEAVQYVPDNLHLKKKVFLAGSIEMGAAEEWQETIIKHLKLLGSLEDLVIFNPRRKNWDANWVQSINNPEFNEQVTWEMDQLDKADLIFFNFCKDTKSPISLLELGLMAHYSTPKAFMHFQLKAKEIIVCCPDGFWRKGNVEMVCARYNLKLYNHFSQALQGLEESLIGR